MEIETLLPLGKTDPGLRAPEVRLSLADVGSDAQLLERLGYDGIVFEETKDDPFVLVTLAAQATTRLKLATGVAIAFPRSPTITALSAWTLQKLSRGRFTLGLGSQVKGAHRAPVRHDLVARRSLDARICPGGPRRLGQLAERHSAQLCR